MAEGFCDELEAYGLKGSMGRRESFMKTLKVEEVYLMVYETFDDVAAALPRFIDEVYNSQGTALRAWISRPVTFEKEHARQMVRSAA